MNSYDKALSEINRIVKIFIGERVCTTDSDIMRDMIIIARCMIHMENELEHQDGGRKEKRREDPT